MKNIMFVAPPAAGKGTQAELVVNKYNIPHISTGDILRDISKEDSEIGLYVRETLSAGKLVKDEITFQLVKDRLSKDDCKNGFIIDGFPRNLNQAIKYDQILTELNYDIGLVFYIDVDQKTLEKRIIGRRICEDCKSVYNINTNEALQMEAICERCGGRLYQRNDDNIESFKTRYKMYLEQTEPIVKHYEEKGVLHRINGNEDPINTFKIIDKIISGSDEA